MELHVVGGDGYWHWVYCQVLCFMPSDEERTMWSNTITLSMASWTVEAHTCGFCRTIPGQDVLVLNVWHPEACQATQRQPDRRTEEGPEGAGEPGGWGDSVGWHRECHSDEEEGWLGHENAKMRGILDTATYNDNWRKTLLQPRRASWVEDWKEWRRMGTSQRVCTPSSGHLVANDLGSMASQRSTSLRSVSGPLSHALGPLPTSCLNTLPPSFPLSRQDWLACEELQALCGGDGEPERWKRWDAVQLWRELPLHQSSNWWSSPSHSWQTARRWNVGGQDYSFSWQGRGTALGMPEVNLLQLRRRLLWAARGCSDGFSRLCCCGEPVHGVLQRTGTQVCPS